MLVITYDLCLTGAKGIGKSIFYAYFFMRYAMEHPSTTIVLKSSSTDRKLNKCIVYCHASGLQHMEAAKYQDYRSINADEELLCLCDGPPDKLGDMKMISFTNPHELWLKSERKAPDHTTVYMPVWTLKVLVYAANILAFGIPEQEIER